MLTQEYIDEVKRETSILELVSEYTTLRKVGDGIYGGQCPSKHHRDSDPSFTVFEKDNSWCCMGCHQGNKYNGKTHVETNYGSDCFAFIQWISEGKMNWRQAAIYLGERLGIPLPSDENNALYKTNDLRATAYQKNLIGKPLDYLKARGLSVQDCKDWRIGFDGKKITFSLLDRYRRILGFTRRWLNPPENCRDKYRNTATNEIFNKSFYFYGIHKYDSSLDYLYITEGSMDVILGDKHGLKNVFAPLGTSFTDQHAEIVKNFKKTPIFIMDGDMAGLNSAKKSIEKLAALGVYAKIVVLPEGKDLADMANELQDSLVSFIEKRTVTYGYYQIQSIITQYESRLLELRLSYYNDLNRLIKEIPGNEKHVVADFVYDKMNLNFKEDNT